MDISQNNQKKRPGPPPAVVEVESHPPSEQYASFRLSESRARVVPLPETHSVLGTASPRGSWHVDSAASAHGTMQSLSFFGGGSSMTRVIWMSDKWHTRHTQPSNPIHMVSQHGKRVERLDCHILSPPI